MEELPVAFRALLTHALQIDPYWPLESLGAVVWCARAAEKGATHVLGDSWTVDGAAHKQAASELGRVLFRSVEGDGDQIDVLEIDGATAYLRRDRRDLIWLSIAGPSQTAVAALFESLKVRFPKKTPQAQGVDIRFWSYQNQAISRDETVDVVRWEDVASNYAANTRAQLDPLMGESFVTEEGKLVLWLGPPGTGKTFALRALAWEQRQRLTVHYILDPDAFLGRVDYIMSVFQDDEDTNDKGEPKSRLIVLEDAGELLGADAVSRVGPGLSRLLNLTDGLPGQATRTRILITTNEDVGRLHPAVSRPGRCSALVRFAPLDEDEVAAWWRRQNRFDERPSPSTVANLYAKLRGGKILAASNNSVGFGTR